MANKKENAFKEYGLPKAIRCDNGGPFGSSGALGLSKITAWITKIGIIVDFIDPGKPQQNGIHERIHRTFKAEAANPPAQSWSAQQRRGRKWQKHYNQERPHESLGQKTPAEVYRKSRRKYQAEQLHTRIVQKADQPLPKRQGAPPT